MIRNINCSCPVKRKMEKIDNKNKSSSDVKAMGKTKMDLVPAKQPTSKLHHTCLEFCSDKDNCLSLNDILRSFNAPLSEEQAWSLIFQSVRLYRDFIHIEFIDKKTKKDSIKIQKSSHRIKVPKSTRSLNVHKDGFVHISDNDHDCSYVTSQKKILLKIGIAVYEALDFNLSQDEECILSQDLHDLISLMTFEEETEIDDEGIERDSEEIDDEKFLDTKELDHVLELCKPRVGPSRNPEDHYRAVCRALATESSELRLFLTKVFTNDAEQLRIEADAETSAQELRKLAFGDWARFWMQVVDELRRGVRLKKINFTHMPTEYEMTPYEILMDDIRSRKYNLRKVMVNGDIPPKVKKDAHAVILEFIRSRPPLRKATDRKLAPLKRNPSPREILLDQIRKGRVLKPVAQGLKNRLLPPTTSISKAAKLEDICRNDGESSMSSLSTNSSQSSRRLIRADFSLFKDEETPSTTSDDVQSCSNNNDDTNCTNFTRSIVRNNENNQNNINTILRRTTYDLATQCESRRASIRRHTIVGCQSLKKSHDSKSVPPSRPDSRQSSEQQVHLPPQQPFVMKTATPQTTSHHLPSTTTTMTTTSNLTSMDSWSKNSLDENQWRVNLDTDRLSLTLEEIVHIRSVITKAELESLPVGIHIKEDVEKRKLCFLCLRTKFGILSSRGVPCRLCKRTVCAKCYTKMRIPTEHFSNVPVQLLSPSLQNSPTISTAPSPSHHHHHHGIDESFPKSLMERLLRTDVDRKSHNTVGSAPSSPRNQRSASSTPGSSQPNSLNPAMTTSVMSAKDSQVSLRNSLMSRSMEYGHQSLPPQSPGRTHSTCSTLDRRSGFRKAFSIMQQQPHEPKECLRGELMAVCNDCKGLVLNIIRYSRQTRSSARNNALKNLTLDLSPVYKR